jgi:hypothetical protein
MGAEPPTGQPTLRLLWRRAGELRSDLLGVDCRRQTAPELRQLFTNQALKAACPLRPEAAGDIGYRMTDRFGIGLLERLSWAHGTRSAAGGDDFDTQRSAASGDRK